MNFAQQKLHLHTDVYYIKSWETYYNNLIFLILFCLFVHIMEKKTVWNRQFEIKWFKYLWVIEIWLLNLSAAICGQQRYICKQLFSVFHCSSRITLMQSSTIIYFSVGKTDKVDTTVLSNLVLSTAYEQSRETSNAQWKIYINTG